MRFNERESKAYKMIKTMTKLWSNFAKFGFGFQWLCFDKILIFFFLKKSYLSSVN